MLPTNHSPTIRTSRRSAPRPAHRGRAGSLVSALLLCGLALAVQDPAQDTGEVPSRPNFVIVLADDMGYGDSSVYGGWVDTPHMARMAEEGLVFTDFHTSGTVCSPTRAGLLTGRYQQRAGIPCNINADPRAPEHFLGLQPGEVTFAESLRTVGYRTGIFGKWHLGYAPRYNPTRQGFERFRGFLSGNLDYVSHYDRMKEHDWWDGTREVRESGYVTHLITKHAVNFIRAHRDEPFCLYVPHAAVHTPAQAPDSPVVRAPWAKETYQSPARSEEETTALATQALDDGLGRILDVLEELEIEERTLVIFLSDNGGAKHMRNDPLRGRKGAVTEGGHRVPAIAWWPGKIAPGKTTDELCMSLDLMPTLLELAGVAPARKLDGTSLVGLLLEGQALGERELAWDGIALRSGPWKLIAEDEGKPELYDLRNDLSEARNLAAEHPGRVSKMLVSLGQWRADVHAEVTPQPGRARALKIQAGRAREGAAGKH